MTNLPETKTLILDFDRGWLNVWFNTPENRNALSAALSGELRAVFTAIRDDRDVRGVVLRGKGGVFCAGGDLKAFHAVAQGSTGAEEVAEMNLLGGELFDEINNAPQVVVALVEGAAIAGGLGLCCCCDIVATTNDAKFSLTETQIGIVPAQIAPFVVQRIGLPAARRLMLTGARFDGEAALQLGLVDYAVSGGAELETIEAEIRKSVMRCAPHANAVTKEIVLAADRAEPKELRKHAAKKFAHQLLSHEGREGIASFIEKRKPNWAEDE